MTEDVPPSELVAGKYRLTRLLGRGGMGSVWEGVHVTLGNRVACKFIDPEFVSNQDAVRRFENEARAAASLRSKHIVDVYDHGVMPDGRPYIVMEFLEGEPLDTRLKRAGVLNLVETAAIIQQVSRALDRAHAAGIVHRDLKPENIFLVWDDEDHMDVAKVVDFGIAKFTDSASSGLSPATRTGSIMGTPFYMSPEQARGLKNIDSRADNWSLGVIAYEALTGSRPFNGEAIGDILVKICTVPPIPPSELQPQLPLAIDDWMQRALAIDPANRFAQARELADSLTTLSKLPGRTTYGSAVIEGSTFLDGQPLPSGRQPATTPTRPAGTVTSARKADANAAATNAAVETEILTLPANRPSSWIWLAAAALVTVATIGIALALKGNGIPTAENSPAVQIEVNPPQESSRENTSNVLPRNGGGLELPHPEPSISSKSKSQLARAGAETASPASATSNTNPPRPAVAPRQAPRPPASAATGTASPRTQTGVATGPRPAPKPAVAPNPIAPPQPRVRPAPSPAPSSTGLDLGY